MTSSRLQLVSPPSLVQVRDADGALRRALLVARRDDRCFLQVSRSPGDNVLRWLPSAAVRPTGNPGDAGTIAP
jgi:hypothetical protein